MHINGNGEGGERITPEEMTDSIPAHVKQMDRLVRVSNRAQHEDGYESDHDDPVVPTITKVEPTPMWTKKRDDLTAAMWAQRTNISMADDDSYGTYHRLPSFIKVFSGARNKEEMRLPPQWVAEHGDDLPFDCRLVMPNGTRWPVRLLKIASGCHFCVGWSEFWRGNNIAHEEKLGFTLVDVGIFHFKNIALYSALTHICILALTKEEDDEEIYTPDIDSSDDYAPSNVESKSVDDSDYDDERGELDDDEYPTWMLKLTKSNIKRTIEIPNDFWQLHVRAFSG
ncbi:hypothetical protein SASPL_104333 [Salvia splendens]|uniref:TF-B3 domain-containing protein n=1 Tax=Salvia splendens TaxID=180675 RepID=A0A8X9A8C0_SALSN|nr:hypothetical protein SASPL_104333 [Salvia splendens]